MQMAGGKPKPTTSSGSNANVKIKNKENQGKNDKQNKYLNQKKKESKTGNLKYLPNKKDDKKDKPVAPGSTLLQGTQDLKAPEKGWSVHSSFFNQDFLKGKAADKHSQFESSANKFNFNIDDHSDGDDNQELDDNYDTNLFADVGGFNLQDDEGMLDDDDFDLLDYDDEALEDHEGEAREAKAIAEEGGVFFEDQYSLSVEEKMQERKKKIDQSFKTKDDDLLKSFPSIGREDEDGKTVSMDNDDEMDEDAKKVARLTDIQDERKKKMGGFQGMDLHKFLFKAVMKKGFKQPTPIQRLTIPLILEGQDVVGMARTGSGKTAAFVIPMIQKLAQHSHKVGARAIILSPTRELALQTYRVVKELSSGSDLRSCVIVGGDNMADQFTELARNPDIIIATPGRLVHHLTEVNMGLHTVQYIVFDEADRLFEMGFADQLQEIITKLSPSRQTLLFSATLPSMLAEFVRAGLSNPKLVRLNTDTKISDQLSLSFFTCRHDEKFAALLYLLKDIIKDDEPTIVFTATKFHVEYLHILLDQARIANTFIHGQMDPVARKINLAKFRSKVVNVMVVTDLAARGIDIPMLDNVINFDFAPKEKIFIHRVGRVARAGRKGTAYSLVSPDEIPYMLDLHLYIAKKLTNKLLPGQTVEDLEYSFYGNIPQQIIDRENEFVAIKAKECVELLSLKRTIFNAHGKYVRTRPGASHESNKRAKGLDKSQYHPLMYNFINSNEAVRNDFVQSLKAFRPNQTVFEMTGKKSSAADIMQTKREFHSTVIGQQHRRTQAEIEEYKKQDQLNRNSEDGEEAASTKKNSKRKRDKNEDDEGFLQELEQNTKQAAEEENGKKKQKGHIIDENEQEEGDDQVKYKITIDDSESKAAELKNSKKKTRSSTKDEAFFMSSTPSNYYQERALAITDKFTRDDEVNMGTDDGQNKTPGGSSGKKWDRKKKKFVSVQADADREKERKKWVRNEAGVLVDTSKNKKNLYEEWKKKTNSRIQRTGEEENARFMPAKPTYVPVKWRGNKQQAAEGEDGKKKNIRTGIKDIDDVRKERDRRDHHSKIKHTSATKNKFNKGKGGKGGKKRK
ncbi:putative RNA helicase [Cavenderia fasciculata]|uniref:RNA helicase n=1 Tax=Cavenderia fasciculata TaxID=261658 RepID=F4QEI9_CACFS|nr:putative RNA helicase [Cavenderia fasciculata]EGG14100.1 putative RNA helicase [Cavenderia fasciculata]|eukprot:XP_004350808.1 putative RNA helicase [Cavenderia fasciculata]